MFKVHLKYLTFGAAPKIGAETGQAMDVKDW